MDILKVISNYFTLALGVLAFLAIWGFSILTVYAGTTRRSLPVLEKMFWLALVMGLPLVGFVVYLLAGLAGKVVDAEPRQESGPRREATSARPVVEAPSAPGLRTVAASPSVPAPATTCYLTVMYGPAAGEQFALNSFPARVGRGEEVEIRLNADRRISRRHAEFYLKDGSVYLRDLESMHGTQINGAPVKDQPLRSGDRITVGDSVLVFDCR